MNTKRLMEIIAAIGGAATLAKQLLEAKALAKNLEAKKLASNLLDSILSVQSKLIELTEQNASLRAELSAAKLTLVFSDGVYRRPDGDGPYCPRCFDAERKAMRLSEVAMSLRDAGRWVCPECKNRFAPEPVRTGSSPVSVSRR